MKITVYTINDCKFSQAEKEYLKKNNVEFEEKNLETNRDFLTEMLAVSNNFAGTPVTKIEKDSGETVVLKGFTQEEFDKALGITSETTTQPGQTAAVAVSSTEMKNEEPTETSVPLAATPEVKPEGSTPPAVEPITPAAPAPVESLSQDDSSSVTPSNEMPIPPAVEPLTPAAPATPDSIGPISLSGDQQAAAPAAPESMPDVQTPVAPQTAPAAQPQQPAAAQPASDALNSVLQNLQNQVNSSAPAQDGQKQ